MAAVYTTVVKWLGGRKGHIALGNGPELDFTAPPDAHGEAGTLTPEDAFVAASARKYSLVAESIRCPVEIEPEITVLEE